MKAIYKYKIEPVTFLDLPHSAQVLDIQIQNTVPVIWVKLDTDEEKIKRKFISIPTGLLPEYENTRIGYIGTFQFGELVFHLHEDLDFKSQLEQ